MSEGRAKWVKYSQDELDNALKLVKNGLLIDKESCTEKKIPANSRINSTSQNCSEAGFPGTLRHILKCAKSIVEKFQNRKKTFDGEFPSSECFDKFLMWNGKIRGKKDEIRKKEEIEQDKEEKKIAREKKEEPQTKNCSDYTINNHNETRNFNIEEKRMNVHRKSKDYLNITKIIDNYESDIKCV